MSAQAGSAPDILAPCSDGTGLAGARIPEYALAVLEALRFGSHGTGRLRSLDDASLRKALQFCDAAQLTLTLNHVCRDALPGWVRSRIDRNIRDYSVRFARLERSLHEIADTLDSRGIDFAVLKGTTHSPDFTPDPLLRTQGDIDVWCGPDSVLAARDALLGIGYRPLGRRRERHLPPMIRDSDWQWRGDYFASDLPIAVELHYQLWDERMERIPVPCESAFWSRRLEVGGSGGAFPSLCLQDTLAFASLHLLMHVLHGDVRLQRAWEIANFLETRASHDAFWGEWSRSHAQPLRRLEAIVFQLVSRWFACRLPPAAADEIESLPEDVRSWMERFGQSPIEALFHPNKDELWLHLLLVESLPGKYAILFRRLFPVFAPPRLEATTSGDFEGPAARVRRRLRSAAVRVVHHARALPQTLASGASWCWLRTGLDRGFLRFQAVSAVFCLGMSIFVLLYNLFLLGLGFRETALGQVASLMSVGTVLGAAPAAAIARRVGLRNTLLAAVLGCAGTAFLRALETGGLWPFATALLHGAFFSLWAVSFTPAVAGLTVERNRQRAFSITCAAGIAVGVLGGLAGGQLPRLIQRFSGVTPVNAARTALFLAAACAALGALPALRLRFPQVRRGEARTWPRGRFVRVFLLSICVWSLAVGAFNPFFNAFLAQRWRMATASIGFLFSAGHLLQAGAVLAAPWVLRRLGTVNGVASMQVLTALALALLALSPGAGFASAFYIGYVSFQYMSEPGLFATLMNRVAPGERSGASALMFLTTSIAGSLAALVSGAAISRVGYAAVLGVAAVVAAAAALLFRTLIHEDARAIKSPTAS